MKIEVDNKNKIRKIVKSIVVLSVICLVAALLLGIVNHITAPLIKANLEEKERKALSLILKEGSVEGKVVVENYPGVNYEYSVLDKNGKAIGFVLILTGEGYGGTITLLANFDLSGNLIDARVTDNSETSAISARCTKSFYMKMFAGKGGNSPFPRTKDDLSKEQVDVVSGASITFEAVSSTLNRGSEYIKEKGNK